jgi:uncharacterized membrane protein
VSFARELLVLMIITLVGLALRVGDLGRESIWLDEAFSLDMAAHTPSEIVRGEPLDPGNPPGYYILLHGWLKTFGSTVESGRAFSGFFGTLGIVAIWLLARAAGQSAGVALLASLLVAVSPPLVYLSREVRVYSLFTLMVTLAAAAAEGIIHQRFRSALERTLLWIAFTICAATLSYLHYYSFLLLAVFGLYLFARLLGQGIGPIVCLFISYGVIVSAFLPWLPMFKQQIAMGTTRAGATWLQHLFVLPLYSVAGTTLVWKEDGLLAVAGMTALCLGLIYLPSLYWSWKGRTLSAVSLALPLGLIAIAVFISVAKSPMLQSRYLSPIFPCLMLLIASGIVAGWSLWPRAARVISTVIAGMTIASLTILYLGGHKEDWRPISRFIDEHNKNLPTYCYEDVAGLSLRYYAPKLTIKTIDPVRLHFSPSAESWQKEGLIKEWETTDEGFWFVLYLSLGETMTELAALDGWLREHFDVVHETGSKVDAPLFPFLHLYQLKAKPKAP